MKVVTASTQPKANNASRERSARGISARGPTQGAHRHVNNATNRRGRLRYRPNADASQSNARGLSLQAAKNTHGTAAKPAMKNTQGLPFRSRIIAGVEVIFRVALPNDKVSDGSQPPGTAAPPLGVPAGCRSLDSLVRPNSWVPQEETRPQASAGLQLPTGRRAQGFGQDEQNGQDASWRSPGSEPSCKSCSSCQRKAVMFLPGIFGFWVVERKGQRRGPTARGADMESGLNGWPPFAGPSGWPVLGARERNSTRTVSSPAQWS